MSHVGQQLMKMNGRLKKRQVRDEERKRQNPKDIEARRVAPKHGARMIEDLSP